MTQLHQNDLVKLVKLYQNLSSIWQQDVIDIDLKSVFSDPTHEVG